MSYKLCSLFFYVQFKRNNWNNKLLRFYPHTKADRYEPLESIFIQIKRIVDFSIIMVYELSEVNKCIDWKSIQLNCCSSNNISMQWTVCYRWLLNEKEKNELSEKERNLCAVDLLRAGLHLRFIWCCIAAFFHLFLIFKWTYWDADRIRIHFAG